MGICSSPSSRPLSPPPPSRRLVLRTIPPPVFQAGQGMADAKSLQYATVLRDAARRTPNFAGHYVLASWGCGASCIMSAAIDAKTGTVTWLPFTVCCWEANIGEPLEFRPNSRLLIVHGSRDEQGSGIHYYNFEKRQFSEVPGT